MEVFTTCPRHNGQKVVQKSSPGGKIKTAANEEGAYFSRPPPLSQRMSSGRTQAMLEDLHDAHEFVTSHISPHQQTL